MQQAKLIYENKKLCLDIIIMVPKTCCFTLSVDSDAI